MAEKLSNKIKSMSRLEAHTTLILLVQGMEQAEAKGITPVVSTETVEWIVDAVHAEIEKLKA